MALLSNVAVIDSSEVQPRVNPETGLTVRPTLGPQTGFAALEQAVLELEPGRSRQIEVGDAEETLFVLAGRGTMFVAGEEHALESEVGLYLPPGTTFELDNPGPQPLRIVAVRVPGPESTAGACGPAVCRLADSELEAATTEREFRIVADPATGLRSATHFVGYIPPARAPDHFHTYDEVIYVIDGQGVMHAGDFEQQVSPGVCIQLPARTVHCLHNTGPAPMRVVAVFRPAGSPAAAYYPDGTPAYQGGNFEQLQRRSEN